MAQHVLKLKGEIPENITKTEQEIAIEAQVSKVRIDHGEIRVTYDHNQPHWDTVIKVIRGKNLQIETARETFHVSGMACAACINTIKKAVGRDEGQVATAVNLASDQVSVEFIPTVTNKKKIARRIETAGFGVRDEQDPGDRELKTYWLRAIVALTLMIPGFLISMGSLLFDKMIPGQWWILFFLSTPVMFGAGYYTLSRALRALFARSANMHLLVALGSMSAYLYGLSSYFFEIFNLFSLAAMIMAFHLFGQYLNLRTKRSASREIKRLLQLQAKTAVLQVGKKEKEVKTDTLKLGDHVIVRAGERIPMDGVIAEGHSVVNESMVTGESVPVGKNVGDEVIGGTINENGYIVVEVSRVGQDTFLSQMVRLGQEARWSRDPLLLFADKIIAKFVPVVIGLALFTFVGWLLIGGADAFNQALFASIALMVVASPCVIGLVTPTAFMTGAALGLRNGVVIKDMGGMEVMQRVSTVVFDKTGTITHGKPEVTDITTYHREGEHQLLQWMISVEKRSEHPIGKALAKYVESKGVEPLSISQFNVLPGMGVQADVDGQQVVIGNLTLMKEQNIHLSKAVDQVDQYHLEGKTAMVIAVDGEIAGVVAVADTIKDHATDIVNRLKMMGLRTVMITGDHPKAAKAIAQQVGIDDVYSSVLPAEKQVKVRKMQARGDTVIMVGDGINDAPALNQADVGVAIGGGTDVAVEAADLTLIKGNLNGLIAAVHLGRNITRLVRQNLFWAFIFYLVLFPVAIVGLFNPLMTAFAMLFSFIFVFGNTYRLKKITEELISKKVVYEALNTSNNVERDVA